MTSSCAFAGLSDPATIASDIEDIGALHDAAVRNGCKTYKDPKTGYNVFTAECLRERGKCCGCGCRHCPFNHENVSLEKRASRISAPAMLHGSLDSLAVAGEIDLLFWSGGKDSFLAARALCRERGGTQNLLLLTTFDAGSRQVAHQEVQIAQVVRQAESLGVPLIGCPLWPHIPYTERIASALQLAASTCAVRRVCNGDLHLEHIAAWREEHIKPLATAIGAQLHAPLFRVPYPSLLADLERSGVPCRVCAATGDHPAAVGEVFNATLVAKLQQASPPIDAFGENGEFHTLAETWAGSSGHPLLVQLAE